MACGLTCERTFNKSLVRDILTEPAIWATIAEDGQVTEKYEPDLEAECWLEIKANDSVVGVYRVHVLNSVLLQIHAHVLPEYRKYHSYGTGFNALKWIYENAPEYKKVIAIIPFCFENVKEFTCQFGFQVEGVNRQSYMKNGQLHDQWLLGITRDEIEGFMNG